MKMATIKTDFWELRSGELAHLKNPESFRIPSLAERQNVHRGQAVRLIFDIEGENEDRSIETVGERMWVIVSEEIGAEYVGILDNQPACSNLEDNVYLRFGVEVPFRAEHIIDVENPPQEYVEWQLGQTPERVWPRE